ncbi:hypothetical protein [Rufibacter roseus]|uniref:Uncharacterized protein n=1 Tax=Rufibacter roseus TaxID=1567108 RepID=A0ABW2DLW3_9BACT|nr:hypothetical protein [Rufibacter roseus]
MTFDPFEYLPYSTKDVRPGHLSVGFGIYLHHRDVIGLTKGVMHIEEFYRGKPVLIGKPKRYKHQRN